MSAKNTKKLPTFHILIAAAGSGVRAGSNIPKQYADLNGISVLEHSIQKFQNIEQCDSVRVIFDPQHAKWLQHIKKLYPDIKTSTGGKKRKNSIYNALKDFSNIKDEEIILIHDAARPCVSKQDIYSLLYALSNYRAATLASQITSTMVRANNKNLRSQSVERKHLWEIQTPQAFRYADLLKAHEQAKNATEYTDDTALVSELGIDVSLVQTNALNIKITHPQDFQVAQQLLQSRTIPLTGHGFDVHAFKPQTKGPVRLCGINVKHTSSLMGHSDADVGLHALTDAILGAIAEGDIGQHFPPSDDTFKNMDSAIFLQKALDLLKKHQASLNNIDITLICEEPKIGPYTDKMRERISTLTGLHKSRINIKATTTEKLGFTGRKEGIAAQALVSIAKRCEET